MNRPDLPSGGHLQAQFGKFSRLPEANRPFSIDSGRFLQFNIAFPMIALFLVAIGFRARWNFWDARRVCVSFEQ